MKNLLPVFLAVVVSWYGEAFRGKTTASGEPYNPSDLTAASRNFPIGTRLRVSSGGFSVEVVVNDRVSKKYAHRLDLSPAAFKRLAPLDVGLINANLEIVK